MYISHKCEIYSQFSVDLYSIWSTENMTENELLSRITINQEICHGKPTIRNKRYPVEVILDLLSGGMTYAEILEDCEELENEDILACLAFASKLLRVKSLVFISV